MKKDVLLINEFCDNFKKRCEKMGYKTERQFFEAFSNVYDNVSEYTVHSWWSYVSLPNSINLKRICDFLDCDIDYLYGRIKEARHDYAFIKQVTGLEEESIKRLRDSDDATVGKLFKATYKPLPAAVNYLLTNENGLKLLELFYDYINSKSMYLSYQEQTVIEDIKVINPTTENSYTLSPNEYDAILLAQIQKELISMKIPKEN